jgi:hypothetical protein
MSATNYGLNDLGVTVVTDMLSTWQTYGLKAAQAVRRAHCLNYGERNVDEAMNLFMRARWAELKAWTSDRYPFGAIYSRRGLAIRGNGSSIRRVASGPA